MPGKTVWHNSHEAPVRLANIGMANTDCGRSACIPHATSVATTVTTKTDRKLDLLIAPPRSTIQTGARFRNAQATRARLVLEARLCESRWREEAGLRDAAQAAGAACSYVGTE